MPGGDSKCKYCGDPIRWVDDDGRRLALDVTPFAGGHYRVVGAETAIRIKKADREKFPKLYVAHKCEQWKEAKALQQRARADAAARAVTFPPNVAPFRRPRRG